MAKHFRGRRPRQQLTWVTNEPPSANSLSMQVSSSEGATGTAAYLIQDEANVTDYVLQRTYLDFVLAETSSAISAGDIFQIFFGVGIASLEALVGGALPGPAENSSWDGWLLHGVQPLIGNTAILAGGITSEYLGWMSSSKAKRRIPQGSGIFVGVQARTVFKAGATGSLTVGVAARFLLKTN